MVYNWPNPWQELSTGWFLRDICQSYCQLLCLMPHIKAMVEMFKWFCFCELYKETQTYQYTNPINFGPMKYIYIYYWTYEIYTHTHTVGNCKKKSDKYDIYMYIYPGYVKIFNLLRRDIMFLLASDIISQTIRGDWCTKYSSPLSIRSLSIFGLWRPTSLESPTSKCKMDRVSVSINTPLDRLAENPLK